MEDFRAYLQQRLLTHANAKKTVRTRLQIELAVAELLSESGYRGVSVDLVAERTGLAHGTFYRYFPGIKAATAKMVADYYKFLRDTRPVIPDGVSELEAIFIANLHYIRCFKYNVGFVRCIAHGKDADEEIRNIARKVDASLAGRMLRRYEKLVEPKKMDSDQTEVRLRIYSLISMIDETLFKIYGASEPPLREYQDRPEMIAETLSRIWYETLYGGEHVKEPDADRLDRHKASRVASSGTARIKVTSP